MLSLFHSRYMRISFLGIVILLLFSCMTANHQKAIPWSVRMCDSVIKQNPEPWMIDFRQTPKWEYTQGLVLKAILQVWQVTGEDKYFQYVRTYYDQFVDDGGNIMLYDLTEYNIDRINPGKPLFRLYRETGEEKYKKAIFLLREQMRTHPRTSDGGFWHKKIYPHQMWLDGIYMAAPFLAEFAGTFDEYDLYDEVANQIILMEKHARDEQTGLLYHGWDESRQQRWAHPETGQSPNFWGRAIGWYSMALVDVLDFMPTDHPKRADIIAILDRLAHAIARYQDAETGLWYQIVDQGGRDGNYPESSASSMFVYSLLKAVEHRYIDRSFEAVARKGYEGILKHFIAIDESGIVHFTKTCAVAGLGGNPYRDGSYAYYIGEEIRSDDPKGVGPFILASIER